MLQTILKINGVSEIEKKEQQQINGGLAKCFGGGECFDCGLSCFEAQCRYC